jgi:hypothetical protein
MRDFLRVVLEREARSLAFLDEIRTPEAADRAARHDRAVAARQRTSAIPAAAVAAAEHERASAIPTAAIPTEAIPTPAARTPDEAPIGGRA